MRICQLIILFILALTGLFIFSNNEVVAQTPGTLYGSTGSVGDTLIIINPVTGLGTPAAPAGAYGPVTEIEFRNDGVLFGSTGNQTRHIITIDPITGNEDTVGTHSPGSVNGMEFDGSGNLLGSLVFFGSSDLVTVNQSTGELTTIGNMLDSIVTGLAFSPNGTLYASVHLGGPSYLYTIDPGTGAASMVGPIGFDAVGAIEFSPNGILYGGVGKADPSFAGYLITIDPTTGAGSAVGSTGYPGISGLSFVPQPSSIDSDTHAGIPNFYALRQNYPNPFNPTTHIQYSISHRQFVSLKVYDALGKEIAVLVNEEKQAGEHEVEFDGTNLASGVYFYRIQAGDFLQMKNMVLMK